jgi:methionyl-tRNA formyltransferase
VAAAASERGIAVISPERARLATGDIGAAGAAVAAVVAYGQILPRAVLDLFPAGMVNLHFSLLPRWRGAAPVERAILAGDRVTGVSTMVLDEGMDTGPVLERVEVAIAAGERAGELTERLAGLGAPVLVHSLDGLLAGTLTPAAQDPRQATAAPKMTAADAMIGWDEVADGVVRRVRACHPRPGATTTLRGQRLKILRAATGEPTAGAVPGSMAVAPLRAAAADRYVILEEVQLEGRRGQPGDEFARGARLTGGERLG